MKFSILWNVLFKVLCITGCLVQLISILQSFFSYEMVSLISLNRPEWISSPTVTLCLRYLELLDWNRVETKYGKLFKRQTGIEGRQWQGTLTLSDILDLTPNTSNLLSQCRVRSLDGKIIEDVHPNSFFTITKFMTTEHICYKMTLTVDTAMHFQAIQSSLHYSRVFYEMKLNKPFSSVEILVPVITKRALPRISMAYANKFHKQRDREYSLHLSNQNISVIKLGYPYIRWICESFPDERAECVKSCRTSKTLETFGVIPFDEFYEEHLNHRLVSHENLINQSMGHQMDDIYISCFEMCTMAPCTYGFYLTSGNIGFSKKSIFEINTPSAPTMFVTFVARITFMDVTIYILSSLGIWFGFVIIDYDPLIVATKVAASIKTNNLTKAHPKYVWTIQRSISSE